MRYPTIDEAGILLNGALKKAMTPATFEVVQRCMDKLVGKDEVYNFKDFSQEEVTEFISSLEAKAINKIENFFNTIPSLRHELKYTNSAGTERTFVIQGIQTFFM
jgi:hypothetical protein